jgi:ATP-dependent Clp protease ATP-binding subunit ClpC
VLNAAGLDAAAVRRAVTSALAGFAQARQQSAATGDTAAIARIAQRLDAIERRLSVGGL